MNLKGNQPELLAEAQRAMAGPAQFRQADGQQELELWHAPEVYWLVADRSLSIVKTVRTLKKKRQQISRGQEGKNYLRESFVEQSTNFYASNLVLGLVPPLFIHQLGRSRWRIDTEVFQTITTEGHLKQPYRAPTTRPSLGGVDHDPRFGLHADAGLLPSPSAQSFSKNFLRFLRTGSPPSLSISLSPAGYHLS